LPKPFEKLQALLEEMPIIKRDGKKGLLAKGLLGNASKEIPEYSIDSLDSNVKSDNRLLHALFRDYTFWASAYLLEPCHLRYLKEGNYGLGRDVLPSNISIPLVKIASLLGVKPFMEYALSYALYNWKRINPEKPIVFDNLELIRSFTGSEHEAGFILVHVAMVAHTPDQVKWTEKILESAESKSRKLFNEALEEHLKVFSKINTTMETMWNRSSSGAYQSFRTFIMGIKNQPMFPKGVLYEGTGQTMYWRGESGANDSIIPTADNLFQLYEKMPQNPLTEILKDFRTYRPPSHNKFLSEIEERAKKVGVYPFSIMDPDSTLLYLLNIDQIREFRTRHWGFTKDYIIKYSKHPVATGGSPIVTWLPNQLLAVLDVMISVPFQNEREKIKDIVEKAKKQRDNMHQEIRELKLKFPDQHAFE